MNAPARNIQSQKSELTMVIERLLEKHPNAVDAASALLAEAKDDMRLYESLMRRYEVDAAQDAVRDVISRERCAIWKAAHVRPAAPDNRVTALARANSSALMDFRLPGGLPLRLATAEQIMAASDFYVTAGKDALAKGGWLKRVAQAVPDGKTAGEVMTEDDLKGLMK